MRILSSILVVPILLIVFVAPAAYAQGVQNECLTYCQPYANCGDSCTVCDGPYQIDTDCSPSHVSSCGGEGMTCGQCAIVSTWETDEEVSRSASLPFFCGGSSRWYGVNWSVFITVDKRMRHVTHGQQVCNGVSSTVVLSERYDDDFCYEFRYPDCCLPQDPNCFAPPWQEGPTFEFPSYMECHD